MDQNVGGDVLTEEEQLAIKRLQDEHRNLLTIPRRYRLSDFMKLSFYMVHGNLHDLFMLVFYICF